MRLLTALFVLALPVLPLSAQSSGSERTAVPGELVVCFESDGTDFDLATAVEAWNLPQAAPGVRVEDARSLLQWRRRGASRITNVVLVTYSPARVEHDVLARGLRAFADVRWAAPNTALEGEFREFVPNDPSYGLQYHHARMQNDLAWNTTLGIPSVMMGITDDGVDLDHVDLVANVWTNPGEIAGNGVDDDANGYIDDVHGWDFVFNGNDPNPNGTDDHGTHVAGIAGARTNNAIGVAGTAGGSTILPLQFYSSGQSWTAAIIAQSFAYGVDNGAQILSTSYNMDGWVGDPTVLAAFDYIYDQGALHFNSAGNNNALNPPRQAFHQSFLVASTDANDVKSSFTNYGTGVDVAAPGSSIYATVPNNGYGTKSGTSMAAPNAAGAAALIWSAHPTWTRDQVAAQLYFTADNIDALNPSYAGLLGSGRVNPYRGITQTLPAPKLVSAVGLPAEGAATTGAITTIEIRFDQVMDPAAVNAPGAFSLVFAGTDNAFGTSDDANVALGWDEYLISSNRVRFGTVGAVSASGLYRFTANAAVLANPFGTALDGNGDGTGGDSWTRTFGACGIVQLLVDNAESGVGWSVVNQSVTDGAWDPNPGVPAGGGVRNDPPADYDGSGKCFLTDNVAGNSDVDGGPTILTSRAFDLTIATDPNLSFAYWLVSDGGDVMSLDVSGNNGTSWTSVATLTGGTGWQLYTFRVADFVAPSAQTRLRFSVADNPNNSVTEAAIDYLRVVEIDCSALPVGTTYCVGAVNSTGAGASIQGIGSDVVADNDFTLIAASVPPDKTGVFYFGPNQVQFAFGNGFRCVGGITTRLGPMDNASSEGVATRAVDLTAPPALGAIVAGATVNFQFWFRDPDAGGANFNLSNALSVLWQ
jgi:subtilisin family serine protease